MKPFRTAAGVAAALVIAAGAAHAQGPDARVLPRGTIELRIQGIYTGYDERFGGGRDPLGTAFAGLLQPRADTLSAPELRSLRTGLDQFFAATGGAVETSTLTGGTVNALLSGDWRDVPITVAAGLTSRLTLEAMLPLVKRETEVRAIYLENGTIGVNPNVERNRTILARFGDEFGTLGASPFLPVEGTPAAEALLERIRARDPGGADSLSLPTRGVSIQELLATDARSARLTVQERDAIARRSAGTPFQLGDLEIGGRFRLAGTAPAWALPGDSVAARGFRATAAARVRLPTGRLGNTRYLLQEPAPRGHFGAAGEVAGDWFLSRRWWVTAVADAQLLLGADVTTLAYTAENPFPDTTQTRVVRREPGVLIGASVTPRYRLTQEFSFAAHYRFQSLGADTYSGDGLLSPVQAVAAQTAHRLGIGASYTTVGAYAAGRAPFPVEVSLLYGRTLAGSGGAPADTRLELGFRAYYPR
jgi:hypothetical protein